MKNRNPIAKSLRSPHLRNQVIPDKTKEPPSAYQQIREGLEEAIEFLDDPTKNEAKM